MEYMYMNIKSLLYDYLHVSDSCAHDLDHIREFQVIIEINQTFNHFISKGCEKHFVTAGSFLKGYLVMWEK